MTLELSYREILTLGPTGTFSEEVTQRLFGEAAPIRLTQTMPEAVHECAKSEHCLAVVPIENSVAGIVAQVQDALISENMVIVAEALLSVQHNLVASCSLEEVEEYHAHPQAFGQCSRFVGAHLPHAKVHFSDSNIQAGTRFLKSYQSGKKVAAIVPPKFKQRFPNHILPAGIEPYSQDAIQDFENNTTRFIVIRKRNHSEVFDFSKQKSSIFVEMDQDRPGLLYELLSIFNQYSVNICRLESRPSKVTPWFYVFYLDFHNTPNSEECLRRLEEGPFSFRVLGSYDSVERIINSPSRD